MNTHLIISNISIHQDVEGRYSLNDLHQASGNEQRHRPKYWLELSQTTELIDEILKGGIPPFKNDEILNTQICVFKPVVTKPGRYGGTYVCKELVYSYAMWISAAFALKVIRAYDALVSGQTATSRTSTTDDRTPLRQHVEKLIAGCGLKYPDIWKLVHQRFDVQHINQLTASEAMEAVEYLKSIEGDLLRRPQVNQQTDLRYLLSAAEAMLEGITQVEPLLRVADHKLAARFYSMSREYPRVIAGIKTSLVYN